MKTTTSLHTYSAHEALQFISLGAIFAENAPNSDEWREAHDQENEAYRQVEHQRHNDEVQQAVRVPEADEAHTGKDITLDLLEHDGDNGLDSSHGPNHCM